MPEQHKGQDHDPHPADQGLHFEQILGFCSVTAKQEPERATRRRTRHGVPGGRIEEKPPERRAQARTRSRSSVFTPPGNKNAGNAQQNARRA